MALIFASHHKDLFITLHGKESICWGISIRMFVRSAVKTNQNKGSDSQISLFRARVGVCVGVRFGNQCETHEYHSYV